MKCHLCGAVMQKSTTDLPFKLGETAIAIMKHVPVVQCSNCREYLLDDETMRRIESILDTIDITSELGIVDFAA